MDQNLTVISYQLSVKDEVFIFGETPQQLVVGVGGGFKSPSYAVITVHCLTRDTCYKSAKPPTTLSPLADYLYQT
ncbi:hypothetical protein H6G76_06880 [Nostoc sp. FACHB-152]|uniref:hypothetical protein n=1 Tax=Nostoc sp. FACHB-152 TaxID=2692837 RepID=UPI00168842F8|nr:hypothetical protein [Nostoc sp. FACHB-152]MBD2446890.1 hypothetical protein [Nostoc sp. FACHB-152]MBD2467773.1 hypothetical protein [Nostoc sp. FACHB-145]